MPSNGKKEKKENEGGKNLRCCSNIASSMHIYEQATR